MCSVLSWPPLFRQLLPLPTQTRYTYINLWRLLDRWLMAVVSECQSCPNLGSYHPENRTKYKLTTGYEIEEERPSHGTLSSKSLLGLLSNVCSRNHILRCNKGTCQGWPAPSLTSCSECSDSSGWAERAGGGGEAVVELYRSAYLWVTFAYDTHGSIQNPQCKNCRPQVSTTRPATYLEFRKSSSKEEFRLSHAWNFSLLQICPQMHLPLNMHYLSLLGNFKLLPLKHSSGT